MNQSIIGYDPFIRDLAAEMVKYTNSSMADVSDVKRALDLLPANSGRQSSQTAKWLYAVASFVRAMPDFSSCGVEALSSGASTTG